MVIIWPPDIDLWTIFGPLWPARKNNWKPLLYTKEIWDCTMIKSIQKHFSLSPDGTKTQDMWHLTVTANIYRIWEKKCNGKKESFVCFHSLFLLMTVLKIWLTFGGHGCEKNYLGMKIIQNDIQSNVFLGNFAYTFWFWHLKASVMCIFWDFCNFMAKFGQKSLFWSDIFFDNAIRSMKKTAVMLLIIGIFWH